MLRVEAVNCKTSRTCSARFSFLRLGKRTIPKNEFNTQDHDIRNIDKFNIYAIINSGKKHHSTLAMWLKKGGQYRERCHGNIH